VTDEGVRAALTPLTALTSLHLAGCREVTGEGLRVIASLTSLTDLDVLCQEGYRTKFTNEDMRALAPLTAMTSLRLAGCRDLTDEGFRVLTSFTKLTKLTLVQC